MKKEKDPAFIESRGQEVPTVAQSEEVIRRDAPAALRVLGERNAMDLAEMLGLTTEGVLYAGKTA